MSYLDIRVPAGDLATVMEVLQDFGVQRAWVDFEPPAAGPEVEITIGLGGIQAGSLRAHLALSPVNVLASRERAWERQP